MVCLVIPHMAFFEAAVVDTVYETSEPLGLNSNENDWYQLLALLFDPNRGGGSRGSTCTVSTLDNAMAYHRMSGGKGGIGRRRRDGACDRGPVFVGTRLRSMRTIISASSS